MVNLMTTDPEELKRRLEHDENAWMKYVATANLQHADSLNQIGDLFRLVRQQQAQIDKLRVKINKLEGGK